MAGAERHTGESGLARSRGPSLALFHWKCAFRTVLAATGALFFTAAAHAEFAVCNQTLDVVNIAVGQEVREAGDSFWQTEGWWTVGANQCVNVIRDELVNRYIYIYATDVFGQPLLNGTTPMCVGTRRFVIRESKECWVNGRIEAPFFEVDTQKTERWTLFLGTGGLQ
jgi:uncharacterized membrane protein